MRREPRMYDGWLAHSAAAESQLAVGENCGEGIGAHDRLGCAAPGFGLKIVERAGDEIGVIQRAPECQIARE